MKTNAFLSALRAHAGLPLVFQSDSGHVSPGYHLTEVKEVSFRTMDCGAMAHRWTENQFELWVPPSAEEATDRGHMPADKFLRIVDRVQREIPLDGDADAKVYAAVGDLPAVTYSVESVGGQGERLVVSLRADAARCKARERRVGQACGCGTVNASAAAAPAACCT